MDNKIFVKKPKSGKALFFKVPSRTTPGTEYTVRVMPDGDVRCSCIANTMGNICLHIRYFQKMYNEEHEKFANDIKPEDLREYEEEIKPKKKESEVEKPIIDDNKAKKEVSFGSDFPF